MGDLVRLHSAILFGTLLNRAMSGFKKTASGYLLDSRNFSLSKQIGWL